MVMVRIITAEGHVNESLGPELLKQPFEVTQQTEIDELMIILDGTENKSKFGANAILGVGAAKRGILLYKHLADLAGHKEIILPVPAFNVINSGSHACNKLAMQEFMILPTGANTFPEAMKMGSEIYHHLKSGIKAKFGMDATAVGDEGGFVSNFLNNKDALTLINDAIAKTGYTGRVDIGMNVAASEFFRNEVVDDDLTVTNPKRIETAVEKKACNCLLLKVNQIGTVTESIKAHNLAKANGWGTMVSHRSGETEDTFIADLVVGLSTGQIKTGAPCRSERLAKYNQILRIEEELGSAAKFAGKAFRRPQ
ncbi:hypothetical protein ILUMI_13624 [Ignelater luminosus]|uniref:Enolase n=1 Tax=Ignelater luminosus TaxID=2038154 RepID=A0A8K0CS17_IGNLU|nr:hypothetical protein ILUMI_13624 [Ignelater luminosus]